MRVHLVLRLSHRGEMLSVSYKHAEYTSVKRAEAEAENDLLRLLSVVDVTRLSQRINLSNRSLLCGGTPPSSRSHRQFLFHMLKPVAEATDAPRALIN